MQVVLQKNHIHCGKTFIVGEILDVDEQTANWLIKHNIATAYIPVDVAATTQQADAELSASNKRIRKQSEQQESE